MNVVTPSDKLEFLKQVRGGTLSADTAIELLKRKSGRDLNVPSAASNAPRTSPDAARSWQDRFLQDLVGIVGELLHLQHGAVDLDLPVAEMGLDSLSATEFNNKMRARFGISLQATAFFECRTLRDFYQYMLRIFAKQLTAHYVGPANRPDAAPSNLPAPPKPTAAPAAEIVARELPPPQSGDPIRSALERVWRAAEEEPESARPQSGDPIRGALEQIWRAAEQEIDGDHNIRRFAAPPLTFERLLFERPGHANIEVCGAGSGAPVLLLGGLMNPEGIWHNQIRALAPRFRLFVFNKPGCGRSSVDVHRLSMNSIVDDIRYVLDALNLRDPLPVIGYSFGGMIALALAIRHPARAARLALINSTARLRPRPDDVKRLIDEVSHCPEAVSINGEVDFALAARYREVSRSFDIRDQLATLQQPALVLSAAADGYMDREHGVELARLLKRSRHVELSGCGHFSLLTHPREINQQLTAFLDASEALEHSTLSLAASA